MFLEEALDRISVGLDGRNLKMASKNIEELQPRVPAADSDIRHLDQHAGGQVTCRVPRGSGGLEKVIFGQRWV